MHPVRILVLLVTMLLPSTGVGAPPVGRSMPGLALEVRSSLPSASRAEPPASVHRALRDLPERVERPRIDVLLTRWVEQVAVPGADGKPKIVLVLVPGGLGLAWARRW
jgi:hypothetical protein